MKRIATTSVSNIHPQRRDRCRGGFSLVEMLIVIAISSLVVAIVVSLMISLQKFNRNSVANNAHSDQLLRLAETLRSDIRAGNDVRLTDEGPLLVTGSTGKEVRYELTADGCRRTATTPAGDETRTDLFTIGKATKWNLEQLAPGRQPLVAVTLSQPVNKNASEAHELLPFVVLAAVGADRIEAEPREN